MAASRNTRNQKANKDTPLSQSRKYDIKLQYTQWKTAVNIQQYYVHSESILLTGGVRSLPLQHV